MGCFSQKSWRFYHTTLIFFACYPTLVETGTKGYEESEFSAEREVYHPHFIITITHLQVAAATNSN
jgi:hypothetical protein